MATIRPVWSAVVVGRASAPIAAGGSFTVDIDLATLGSDVAEVQVVCDIGAASGVNVEIFPKIGAAYDTVPSGGINFDASANATLPINGAERRIAVTNLDQTNGTGDVLLHYRHRHWEST